MRPNTTKIDNSQRKVKSGNIIFLKPAKVE